MKSKTDPQALDRIWDSFIEDILSTPDEEILREAAEDCTDPDIVIGSFFTCIGRAKLAVTKNKLYKHKNSCKHIESHSRVKATNLNDAQLKKIIDAISSQKNENELSLAARNRKELTAQDIRLLIEDLEVLGYDLDSFIKDDSE